MDRHRNRRCPPYAEPFSRIFIRPRRSDVPVVGAGSSRTGVNRTAKAVLAWRYLANTDHAALKIHQDGVSLPASSSPYAYEVHFHRKVVGG